jgi:hypothetical protein
MHVHIEIFEKLHFFYILVYFTNNDWPLEISCCCARLGFPQAAIYASVAFPWNLHRNVHKLQNILNKLKIML